MEFLRCKSVIALVFMLLMVSYISVSDNLTIQNHSQDNGREIVENV